jgi:hypothetical protein
MPRKSRQQRLAEGNKLIGEYESSNMTNNWSYGFLNSIVIQLESGKQLSKRQRTTFDDMIDEGVPKPKGDKALLSKIDDAIAYWKHNPDRDWETGILGDLRRNVFNAWELSDKQRKLLNNTLNRCDDDKAGLNDFTPTDEQINDLRILTKLFFGYDSRWQHERPALAKAVDRVIRYLSGETNIEQYHYDKLMKAMGSRLKKVRNPRFKKGDLSQVRQWDKNPGKSAVIFCMSEAYINKQGEIVNDWMVPVTGIRQYNPDQLPKRLKK